MKGNYYHLLVSVRTGIVSDCLKEQILQFNRIWTEAKPWAALWRHGKNNIHIKTLFARSLHGNESRLNTFHSHSSKRVPSVNTRLSPATINLLYPICLELVRYNMLFFVSCSAFIREDNEAQMLFVRYFAGLPRAPLALSWSLMDLVKLSALGCWIWTIFLTI